MKITAHTSDHVAEHLRLEWTPSDEADQRAISMEAIAALDRFAGSWFEPLAIEIRLGSYDHEIFTEGKPEPAQPYQLLVQDPTPERVDVKPYYRVIENRAPSLSSDVVRPWVERALAQSSGDPARYETSLRNLYVHASRIALPPHWAGGTTLPLECYAGTLDIPIDDGHDGPWIATPPASYVLYQPIVVHIDNVDDGLWFKIQIYWTPWVGELARPGSPLAEAVARLEARGWKRASD